MVHVVALVDYNGHALMWACCGLCGALHPCHKYFGHYDDVFIVGMRPFVDDKIFRMPPALFFNKKRSLGQQTSHRVKPFIHTHVGVCLHPNHNGVKSNYLSVQIGLLLCCWPSFSSIYFPV